MAFLSGYPPNFFRDLVGLAPVLIVALVLVVRGLPGRAPPPRAGRRRRGRRGRSRPRPGSAQHRRHPRVAARDGARAARVRRGRLLDRAPAAPVRRPRPRHLARGRARPLPRRRRPAARGVRGAPRRPADHLRRLRPALLPARVRRRLRPLARSSPATSPASACGGSPPSTSSASPSSSRSSPRTASTTSCAPNRRAGARSPAASRLVFAPACLGAARRPRVEPRADEHRPRRAVRRRSAAPCLGGLLQRARKWLRRAAAPAAIGVGPARARGAGAVRSTPIAQKPPDLARDAVLAGLDDTRRLARRRRRALRAGASARASGATSSAATAPSSLAAGGPSTRARASTPACSRPPTCAGTSGGHRTAPSSAPPPGARAGPRAAGRAAPRGAVLATGLARVERRRARGRRPRSPRRAPPAAPPMLRAPVLADDVRAALAEPAPRPRAGRRHARRVQCATASRSPSTRPRPGVLVVHEAWAPGWTARVDGAPAPVLRAVYLFRGLLVGPGRRAVELEYRPRASAPGWRCTASRPCWCWSA